MRTVRTALETFAVDHMEYPDHAGDTWHPSLLEIPQLTTPIAYLSSLPLEPFQRRLEELYSDPEYFGDGRYYRYYNTERWESTYPKLTQKGYKWFLMSNGPDLDIDVHDDGGMIAVHLLNDRNYMYYDPTNGTLSSGDIINSNLYNAP